MLTALLATSAHALGLGSSLGVSVGDVGGFPPTFDLDFGSVYLQIRATETLNAAFAGDVFLGANVYVDAASMDLAGSWRGVAQPGGGLALFGDPTQLVISGQCRLGAQAEEKAGFGVYVVPEIGLLTDHGDANLFAGGALQISAWFPL